MSEKEAIMTKSNTEKGNLIQQNNLLRRALTPETKLKYDQYMYTEKLTEKLRLDLENTKDEMSKLQVIILIFVILVINILENIFNIIFFILLYVIGRITGL